MPSYGPWTWSQPHYRHYSYLLADDGVTVLDTVWAGPATDSIAVTSDSSTPRTSVSKTLESLQAQSPAIFSSHQLTSPATQPEIHTYASQSHRTSSGGQLYEHTGPSHETGRGEAYSDQKYGAYSGSGLNYITQPGFYGWNPFTPAVTALTGPASGRPPYDMGYRQSVASLPVEVQSTIQSLDRRYIQTNLNETSNHERLDSRYRRVAAPSRATFFVLGRVFKMLWTEPAGQANPGKTRNSTHFSTVQFGESAFSEIRRFLVVRNKGAFSQCVPIQTYKGRGATRPGVRMSDHGIIHTTPTAPSLLPGEALTKYSIQVQSTEGEYLEPESRVNYGKAYAVEHNVKVLDVGMVIEDHRYLIRVYFDAAMQSE